LLRPPSKNTNVRKGDNAMTVQETYIVTAHS
jgi:hypothetical protein